MSNNIVSEPLSTPHCQMDSTSEALDVLIPNMQMGMMGVIVDSPSAQQLAMSNMQMGLVDPVTNDFGRHFLMANNYVGNRESITNNVDSQKMFLPSKRMADGELKFQPLAVANQNSVPVQPLIKKHVLNQQTPPSKRTSPVNSKSGVPGAPNKKMVRNDSGKSKQTQASKNRVVPMEPSPKASAESSESMRAKMRESLASALSLVAERKDKVPVNDNNTQKELEDSQKNSVQADSASAMVVKSSPQSAADKVNDGLCPSQGSITVEKIGDSSQESKGVGQGVQCSTFFPIEDVSFGDDTFIKDDLLQGNGLSWAMTLDVEVEEPQHVQVSPKTEVVNEAAGGETEPEVRSSERLATEIEAELFKLFGGVNKKYKEKGRSLLFNLKDRSNPELRERVMSGDIRPERLCSMTPEELASKELSEWRIAKAEELDHLKVLPDSDVDIRRLVKKTHKGDIQVEVEQDDGVSVEVSIGGGSLPPLRSTKKNAEVHSPSERVPGVKSGSENPDCGLTIPNDGTDFMQGLMADDEFKDAEHLPPIVSLDEFMESLDSEPPFQNLHGDGENMASPTPTEEKSSDGGDEVKSSGPTSKELVEPSPAKPHHSLGAKLTDSNVMKSYRVDVKMESPPALKPSPRGVSSKGHLVWEGLLQLSVSAAVPVVGFFRSGEATSTKEWPTNVEIKGRVRMDAFEKFVQGLPMSRSRAVMVTHFVLKDGSSEIDYANLNEASQSLVMDDRLGFAEPVPGVEIYFFPPQSRAFEMLRKYFPINQTEPLNSTVNGLIGMIVWRRPHLSSTISPNSSSHHKHGSSKPHFSSRRETNVNVNYHMTNPSSVVPIKTSQTHVDDDDDIPPGFGPNPAREDDDLPEFNFSGGPNQPAIQPRPPQPYPRGSEVAASPRPTKPVEAIRELIQKYGKPGNDSGEAGARFGVRSWNNNDEDDDDIPEWQPQGPAQPMLRPHISPHLPQHHSGPASFGGGHLQPNPAAHGTRWAQPPTLHGQQPAGGGGQQQRGGSNHGVPVLRAGQGGPRWRQQDSASRSRGF